MKTKKEQDIKKTEKPEEKPTHEHLQKEIEDLKKKNEEYISDLKRLQAEFENYQKRISRENENFKKYANSGLISNLLKVLDDFENALEHNNDEGFKMIFNEIKSTLGKEGLKEIHSIGKKYDPYYHEVIQMQENNEEEGTIINEIQKGYMMHEKVLRHSKVIISGGKKQ